MNMKNLIQYIKEATNVSTLFDDDYSRSANNYIDYNDGDKTFGELKTGDTIFYFVYNIGTLNSIKLKDGLKVKNNVFYLPCDSYQISKQLKNVKNNKFIIGPTNGSCKFGKKDYNPHDVEKSSVCVGVECVFGTNEETVKKNVEENLFRKQY